MPIGLPQQTKKHIALFFIAIIVLLQFAFVLTPTPAQAQDDPFESGLEEISVSAAQAAAASFEQQLSNYQAQQAADQELIKTSNLGIGNTDSEVPSCGWLRGDLVLCSAALISRALKGIMSTLLAAAAKILNIAFSINTELTPLNMPVVIEGWKLMRNLANALFILIVLWIAFTIIFNIEQFGGKALLVRVIIVALLINFSLALVSVVFAFTNVLTLPLAQKINNGALGTAISGYLDIQSLSNEAPTATEVAAAKQLLDDRNFARCGGIDLSAIGFGRLKGFSTDTIIKALRRDPDSTPTDSPREQRIQECAKKLEGDPSIDAAIATVLESDSALHTVYLKMLTNNTFAIVLYTMLIGLFLYMSAYLAIRIGAMLLLSVLGPLAFLAFIIPGRRMSGHFGTWAQAVFQWAFYAPILYLFIYIVMRFLANIHDIIGGAGLPQWGEQITAMFFVVVLMIAAIKTAKVAGGKYAAAIVTTAKMVTVGAATVVTAPVAPVVVAAVARSAVGARIAGGMSAITGGRVGATALKRSQARIDDKYEKTSNTTSRELVAQYNLTPDAGSKTAIARRLAERKQMSLLGDPTAQDRAVQLAERFGRHNEILNAAPSLTKKRHVAGAKTDEEAYNFRVSQIKNQAKINDDAFRRNTAGELDQREVARFRTRSITAETLSQTAKQNRGLFNSWKSHIEQLEQKDKEDLFGDRLEKIESFLRNHMGPRPQSNSSTSTLDPNNPSGQ